MPRLATVTELDYAQQHPTPPPRGVLVSRLPNGDVVVTDGRNPHLTQVYTPPEWIAFVNCVKAGEFDFGFVG
mgnify:CR=1 FL=1